MKLTTCIAVHRIIDIIVLDHEKQTVVIEMGCHTMLNSLIDQLLLQNASNAFVDLKSVRQQYNSHIKRKVLDLVAEASSSQGISERQAIKPSSSSCARWLGTRS